MESGPALSVIRESAADCAKLLLDSLPSPWDTEPPMAG